MHFEKIYLTSIDSTNNYAKQHLAELKTPTIIYTDYQTKGRGQQHNVWYSQPSKNLLCSIVLPMYFPLSLNTYISRWTALLLVELLKQHAVEEHCIKIKWPNDLLILLNKQYKKIAGILIENNIEKKYILKTIIGIGLNVNQTDFDRFNKTATSLSLVTSHHYSIASLITSLEKIISNYFHLLELQQLNTIHHHYLKFLYGWQSDFLYKEKETIFKGKIIALSDDGKITVQTSNNQIHQYENKQIQFIF